MNIAETIDHTYLKADCNSKIVGELCSEAIKYGFASVCVPPNFVHQAADLLSNESVKVCTVIGFPLGYQTTETKVFETNNAIRNGATEIDMVIPVGQLKEGNFNAVQQDIQSVYDACQSQTVILKVIIETALLSEEDKLKVLEICSSIEVDYVKTSTGFSTAGATKKDVTLMRSKLPSSIKIKAAGGIKTKKSALELLEAGADRLGCSSGIAIVN